MIAHNKMIEETRPEVGDAPKVAWWDRLARAALLKRLDEHGIAFKDLKTSESSLEEIFVKLVGGAHEHPRG